MEDFLPLNSQILELIQNDPLFKQTDDIELNYHKYRELTFKRLSKIIQLGLIKTEEITTNPNIFWSIINTLHFYDPALGVKLPVNFGLFAVTLFRHGEPNQVKKYIRKIDQGKIFGCFAMTEKGHGSNLERLETVAVYDKYYNGFFINTPTTSAAKCWIGNAACHGTHAVVFAQLIHDGKNKGLHTFLVKIRNTKTGEPLHGITIEDNGYKGGLNGVDNGTISFHNFFVKRTKLLKNYGYIDKNGQYIYQCEDHKNPKKRFGEIISSLSGGRGVIASGSLDISWYITNLACLYGLKRKQFNFDNPKGDERPIINYQTHYMALIPLMAKNFAFQYGINWIKEEAIKDFNASGGKISKYTHIMSSGLKRVCTEHGKRTCSKARELCGANGYSYSNKIVKLMGDVEIYSTFEGDNTVLALEMVRDIMKQDTEEINNYLNGSIQKYSSPIVPTIEGILALLEKRTKYLEFEIAKNLRDSIMDGVSPGEALNKNMQKVIHLADTFIYWKVYEIFMKNHHKLLHFELIRLFGLSFLVDNIGWYISNGLINLIDYDTINNDIAHISQELSSKEKLTYLIDFIQLPKSFYDVPMLREKYDCKL